MTVAPTDDTPFFSPLPNVSTRIIWDRWIDTNGNAIPPPTITYTGGPYTNVTYQTTIWPADSKPASVPVTVDDTNVGVWFAEVLVADDPDLAGEVVIKISSPKISGGSIQIQVPYGVAPLHLGDALIVTGPATGPFQYAGENIALDVDGVPYFIPNPGG